MISISILAIWGAIVSTIAVIWNIYTNITNRGKLKLRCQLIEVSDLESGEVYPGEYLAWSITNIGRYPIPVVSIGYTYKYTYKTIHSMIVKPTVPLPIFLQPYESITQYMDWAAIDKSHKPLKSIWVGSYDNIHFEASMKDVKRINNPKKMSTTRLYLLHKMKIIKRISVVISIIIAFIYISRPPSCDKLLQEFADLEGKRNWIRHQGVHGAVEARIAGRQWKIMLKFDKYCKGDRP